ncbi:aminoacyl-tRNA hydrolase [bacterium]|nr:aminoacyl-tRNA hydrolase [bacterium]
MGIVSIIGLGNPGAEYTKTRHNIGFMIVEAVARKYDLKWHKAGNYSFAKLIRAGRSVLLVKPMTFMNNSGIAVKTICSKFNFIPEEILIIMDDINLPFDQFRIRERGSDGGHNGLASIIDELNSDNIPRFRIGVGAPLDDAVDHVLGEFDAAQKKQLPSLIKRATRAVDHIIHRGLKSAMDTFNRKIEENLIPDNKGEGK